MRAPATAAAANASSGNVGGGESEGVDAETELRRRTGLGLGTYAAAGKVLWGCKHVEAVRKGLLEEGTVAWGTVDSWIVANLTRRKVHGQEVEGVEGEGKEERCEYVHVTDVTNASRTMFMDLKTCSWSEACLDFFSEHGGVDLRKLKFPKIVPSSDGTEYGTVTMGPLEGVRITACLGDQSAALVGQLAFEPGMAKNTYGKSTKDFALPPPRKCQRHTALCLCS